MSASWPSRIHSLRFDCCIFLFYSLSAVTFATQSDASCRGVTARTPRSWPAPGQRHEPPRRCKAHGGPDKVVYAYAVEDARWWQQQIGRSLGYGEFGENLTTEGIEVNDALVGERWQIGTTVLEVSEPRIPCWRLGVRMNDKLFPRQFTEALRPGSYFRLIVEGSVGQGDEIRVVERPAHGLTIRDVFRIYTRDRDEVQRLLTAPRMSESWKRWAVDWLQKSKGQPPQAAEPGCCES
jgi:MOSC domain-containing protein YiiM